VEVTTEAALVERAKKGDREAFAQLYSPLERAVAAFLYRMTAMRQDSEDLAQETALAALENIAECPGGLPFRTWIFRIAFQLAMQYLEGKGRWDPDRIVDAGRKATEDSSARRGLQKLHQSGIHTTYSIREHIDFCFTCMGRAIPPQEQSALLLAEVHGLPAGEAAEILGIPLQLLEFRVSQARQSLAGIYESRCSLIHKQGACTQCASLDSMLYGDRRHTEQALFQIELEPQPTPEARAATLANRLAIVRSIDPLHAEGTRLHDALMSFTRQANGW
jgi:RNA polymerase sigma-70 factor (ECF subfamily)